MNRRQGVAAPSDPLVRRRNGTAGVARGGSSSALWPQAGVQAPLRTPGSQFQKSDGHPANGVPVRYLEKDQPARSREAARKGRRHG